MRIDLKPKASPRPRVTRNGHVYYPDGYDTWLDHAALLISQQIRRPLDGPVHADITITPTGYIVELSEGPERPKGIRFDLDNGLKAIGDALQYGGAFADDRQLTSVSVRFAAD